MTASYNTKYFNIKKTKNNLLKSIYNSHLQNTAWILAYFQIALWSFNLFIATKLVLRNATYQTILFSGDPSYRAFFKLMMLSTAETMNLDGMDTPR